VVEQNTETIEWGLIRSAEVGDDRGHNQIICNKISALIEQYPEMAEQMNYFDSEMVNRLLGYLEDNFVQNFPPAYQAAFDKFFRMVEHNELLVMMETIKTAFAFEKKKGKSYTIVQPKGSLRGEAELPLSDPTVSREA
jgi:hypothetical protein